MNWDECVSSRLVRKIGEDDELVDSLVESSKDRIEIEETIELSEKSVSTKISIVYESLREVLEALAIKKGYKIYNHECYSGFLSEVCGEEEFSERFDKFRTIRNKVNYYAKKVSVEDAKGLIDEMIRLRKGIFDKYFRGKK